jgi:hypothetical protein
MDRIFDSAFPLFGRASFVSFVCIRVYSWLNSFPPPSAHRDLPFLLCPDSFRNRGFPSIVLPWRRPRPRILNPNSCLFEFIRGYIPVMCFLFRDFRG